MNVQKMHKAIALPVILSILFFACKKEIQGPHADNPENTIIRSAGAVADDPAKIAKLPMIMSADFIRNRQKYTTGADLLTARKNSGKPGSDVTAPTVAITSPADGSSVSGTVTISVSATDNIGVSTVSLSVDGTVIGSTSSSPYNFSWNTTNAADGSHTLTAKATDAAGNTGTANITVAKNTTITVVPPSSTIPSNFSLLMPPVGYQGGEWNCVAFSTTYAARSVEQFNKTNAAAYSYTTNIFSPEFVYNQTKFGDCGSGTGITTALDFLKNTGVCTWQTMPYSYTNGCSLMPTATQTAEAANYKINSYAWLYASDMTGIKTMLVNKHAVIISVDPDDSFNNATAGFIWKAYSGPKTPSHSLVICGYDDAKHAYKVMNSWGTNWGDAGYSWIDYDFFPYTGPGVCYVITG